MVLRFILFWGFLVTPHIVLAAEAFDEAEPEDPYSVVVTAKRQAEPLVKSTRMVDVIDRAKIEEVNAASMADALDRSLGVFVQRTNRGAGSPIIRGLVGPQNLIVIDGVRFNTSTFRTGPNQYLQLFDPHAVQRLEVLKGPSSVLYGTGAMGGVLQVFPKRYSLKQGPGGDASLRLRSADLGTGVTTNFWTGHEKSQLSLGLSYDHPRELRAGRGFIEPMSSHQKTFWRASATHQWSAFQLEGSYFGAFIDDAGRTDKLGLGDVRLYDNVDHFTYLRFRYFGSGAIDEFRVTVNHHRLDEHIARYNCARELDEEGNSIVADAERCASLDSSLLTRKRLYDDRVDSLGASLLLSLHPWSERMRILIGSDFHQDFVSSKKRDAKADNGFEFITQARGNFSDESRFREVSAFLHGDMEIYRYERFSLATNAGARFSHFYAFAPDVPDLGDVTYQHAAPVFSLGLQALYGDWLNVYAGWAQGFRSPNLQETTVLGDTGSKFEVPNADLGPEGSDSFEVGVKLRSSSFSLDLAGFYGQLKDVIDEAPATYEGATEIDGSPVVRRKNGAKGLVQGVEGKASFQHGDVRLFTGATWMEGEIENRDGDVHVMRRIPPLFGFGGIRYGWGKLGFFQLSARWALDQTELHPSDRKDHRICQTEPYSGVINPDCSGTPGWFSLNLEAGVDIRSDLSLLLSAQNLLDQQYRIHGSGFFAPGFDVRLTVQSTY